MLHLYHVASCSLGKGAGEEEHDSTGRKLSEGYKHKNQWGFKIARQGHNYLLQASNSGICVSAMASDCSTLQRTKC